jgi:hypothetical protein
MGPGTPLTREAAGSMSATTAKQGRVPADAAIATYRQQQKQSLCESEPPAESGQDGAVHTPVSTARISKPANRSRTSAPTRHKTALFVARGIRQS